MKRMLINATQPEEVRVALVDGQKLFDLDIELVGREQKKANIYKGTITRVEPSLEAAFVDYGGDRHGFLPLKEISREYFVDKNLRGRPKIKEAIAEGQQVIVQIDKEERGNKGAALTTFVSLAGSYLVLMPNNPRAGGISRRIEGEEREELRNAMRNVQTPKGMGCIVRTAGVGRNAEELEWDMEGLQKLWSEVKKVAEERPAPFLIHQESDVIIRALRDYLRSDIGEIIVDKKEVFEKVKAQIRNIRPAFENRVKLNEDREIPLFTRFQIESQIETAYQREVRLPSGGSIVIDPTEALVSIDINSSRATKGADIEETALQTNKEAAVEVARQLRLRDMGGLVVIDFIDMYPVKNQREVESVLKAALTHDRARVQVGKISRFGLLEMSRQRLKPSLGESAHNVCPRCTGTGAVRGIESLALSIMRLLEEEATKESTTSVQALLPVEVATFLLNEKRKIILAIEKRQKVQIYIIPNPYMETPNYEIVRMRGNEKLESNTYDVPEQPNVEITAPASEKQIKQSEKPAISAIEIGRSQAPAHIKKEIKEVKEPGLFKKLWQTLFGKEEKKDAPKRTQRSRQGNRYDKNRSRNNYRRNKNTQNRDDSKTTENENTNKPRQQKQPANKRPQRSRTKSVDKVDSKEQVPQVRKPRQPRQSREDRQKVQQEARETQPVVNTETKPQQDKKPTKPVSSKTVKKADVDVDVDVNKTTTQAEITAHETPKKRPVKATNKKPVVKADESKDSDNKVTDTTNAEDKPAVKPVATVDTDTKVKQADVEIKPELTTTVEEVIVEKTTPVETVKAKSVKADAPKQVKPKAAKTTLQVEEKPAQDIKPVIRLACKSFAPATKPEPAEAIPALSFEIQFPTFAENQMITEDVVEAAGINKSYSPTTKASAII